MIQHNTNETSGSYNLPPEAIITQAKLTIASILNDISGYYLNLIALARIFGNIFNVNINFNRYDAVFNVNTDNMIIIQLKYKSASINLDNPNGEYTMNLIVI